MKVYQHLDEIERDPNTVLTIGTFDGIHLGHQEILKKLFERSRFHKARSFLITFHPHPRKVIAKANDLKILSIPAEKTLILEKMGLENLFIINFTKEFSQQSPMDFFKNFIINKIGLKEIVIGHDHKFGKGREGTSETLKMLGEEYRFELSVVDEFKVNGETISSTKLRHAIMNGDMKQANLFLGRTYSFSGTVISGDKRGRLLGYPTANIKLDDKKITVNVLDQIRKEEKFSSPEELINQMNKDREAGIKIFNKISSLIKINTANNYKN